MFPYNFFSSAIWNSKKKVNTIDVASLNISLYLCWSSVYGDVIVPFCFDGLQHKLKILVVLYKDLWKNQKIFALY